MNALPRRAAPAPARGEPPARARRSSAARSRGASASRRCSASSSAGILLGPTLFGRFAPELCARLYPAHGRAGRRRSRCSRSSRSCCSSRSRGSRSISAGCSRACAWRRRSASPASSCRSRSASARRTSGRSRSAPRAASQPFVFALFIGTALAISALPVIAKTLVDLDLYRTDLGALVIGSAVLQRPDRLDAVRARGRPVPRARTERRSASAREIAITFAAVAARAHARPLARAARAGLGRPRRAATPAAWSRSWSASRSPSAALTESVGHGALMGAFLAGVVMGGTIETSPRRLIALERLVARGLRAALLRQPRPAHGLRRELRPRAGARRVRDRVRRQGARLRRWRRAGAACRRARPGRSASA